MVSVAVAALFFRGVDALTPHFFVEMLLANNVALVITLPSLMGIVVWLLHREFAGDAVHSMDSTAKHALIAFIEGMARARQQQATAGASSDAAPDTTGAHTTGAHANHASLLGIHMTDKTGTITRNKMQASVTRRIGGCRSSCDLQRLGDACGGGYLRRDAGVRFDLCCGCVRIARCLTVDGVNSPGRMSSWW